MARRPKKKESSMWESPVLEIVSEPQCLGCAHNKGIECDIYGQKPMKFIMGERDCPEKEAK